VPHTLVSFHAHPDDEVLLTGGTLARAAAEGHRVVLVVATDGGAGLADGALTADLAAVREAELRSSAAALGCARVILLGYADSGLDGRRPGRDTFSRADPRAAARRLAQVLREEAAAVLTIYDPAGGYGHPDHRQVHAVGVIAAELAGTPVVLEATLDRTLIRRLARLVSLIPGGLGGVRYEAFATAFSARDAITHRVDVHDHLAAKRRAMRAHASQAGGDGPRTLGMLLMLPGPAFRRLLGREWFVERGRRYPTPSDDIFSGLTRQDGAQSR
jgi:LmbE family N-acetylglucosaminyl deacetylase